MPSLSLVPYPLSVSQTEGPPFLLGQRVSVINEGAVSVPVAQMLEAQLSALTAAESSSGPVCISTNEDGLPEGDEAYRLVISEDSIAIQVRSDLGVSRALATIHQLLSHENGFTALYPIEIVDAPRFEWRGLSMDVSRSFFPVEEMKVVIDLLAHFKMNTLHLHLTDDQGWRIEIPSRPLLTEVSGRVASDDARAGFYSREEYLDLVRYGALRGVTVMPEFDSPGHTNSATHAYGELLPDGVPTAADTGARVGFSRLYADLPSTMPFLEDVFRDLAEVNPSSYVHIGGDEASELSATEYSRLVEMAAAAASATGKKIVGWQEVATADLPRGSVIQYWNPRASADKTSIAASVSRGAKVLMSPVHRAYFDMKYDQATTLGQDWGGIVELAQSYDWDPAAEIEGVPEDAVIGVEAGMWTEYIHTLDDLTYMLLPRLGALAEVGWTRQDARDWADFATRIAPQGAYWDQAGLSWHKSVGVAWDSAT